jgi:hypothetical protein
VAKGLVTSLEPKRVSTTRGSQRAYGRSVGRCQPRIGSKRDEAREVDPRRARGWSSGLLAGLMLVQLDIS